MRDDSQRWAPPRDPADEITAPGVTIKPRALDRLTLLSGPRVLRQTELPLIAWPDVGFGDTYALSLRRDRVLEVNGPARADGYDADTGLAVSTVTDAYAQVDLFGPNALCLLNRGTDLDLATPSRSAARLLFGFGVVLYRHSAPETFRIHVASSHDDALWQALKDASRHLT
ncbi:MAG: hypothetical protein AAFY25_09410 [Pseudomonadota bacterium]